MTTEESAALEAIRDNAASTFGRRPLSLDLTMGTLIGLIGRLDSCGRRHEHRAELRRLDLEDGHLVDGVIADFLAPA